MIMRICPLSPRVNICSGSDHASEADRFQSVLHRHTVTLGSKSTLFGGAYQAQA